jgi:hypothetical protein
MALSIPLATTGIHSCSGLSTENESEDNFGLRPETRVMKTCENSEQEVLKWLKYRARLALDPASKIIISSCSRGLDHTFSSPAVASS